MMATKKLKLYDHDLDLEGLHTCLSNFTFSDPPTHLPCSSHLDCFQPLHLQGSPFPRALAPGISSCNRHPLHMAAFFHYSAFSLFRPSSRMPAKTSSGVTLFHMTLFYPLHFAAPEIYLLN